MDVTTWHVKREEGENEVSESHVARDIRSYLITGGCTHVTPKKRLEIINMQTLITP